MRRSLVIVLCWLVMFGNASVVFWAPTVAAKFPVLQHVMIQTCVVAALSFVTAVLLRMQIIKTVNEEAAARSRSATAHEEPSD